MVERWIKVRIFRFSESYFACHVFKVFLRTLFKNGGFHKFGSKIKKLISGLNRQRFEPDNPEKMEARHYNIGSNKFIPFLCKIWILLFMMMVILKQFSHHQKAPRRRIFRMVPVIKIWISELMPEPVYDRSLYRPHNKMNRKKEKPPKIRRKNYIKGDVCQSKQHPRNNMITEPVEPRPYRNIFFGKLWIRKIFPWMKSIKNPVRMQHHL